MQIYQDLVKYVKEKSDSDTLRIQQEELFTLLDAMSTFTKHENQEEMNNMLCMYM